MAIMLNYDNKKVFISAIFIRFLSSSGTIPTGLGGGLREIPLSHVRALEVITGVIDDIKKIFPVA